MTRARISDWLGSAATVPATKRGASDWPLLLQTLTRNPPGQWSQNLLELSNHFRSAAFLAINTKATQASGSTFEIHERTDDPDSPGGTSQLPHHDPIHELFQDPNPTDTFHDLIYQVSQQKNLTGVALTWKVPTRDRDVNQIYCIPSATAWPMPPTPEHPFGAYRVTPYYYGSYSNSPQSASGALIPAEQIIRIKNHHPLLRYDGYAVLTACSLQVDTLEAIDKGRFNTQALGCNQDFAIELDGETSNPDESDLNHIRAQLQSLYAGPANSGKIIIPPAGGKVNKFSTAPNQMAYESGWMQVLDFVLACYGTPKAVCGLQEAMSYATLYSSLRAFGYLSLGPELNVVAQTWNKHIVRPTWGREFLLRLIPPEFKDEALEELKWANDLKCGSATIAERRRYRGFDHLDEPWTKDRAIQVSGAGPGGKEMGPKQDGQEEDPDVNNARPKGLIRDDLLAAFEHGKTNGVLKPIK